MEYTVNIEDADMEFPFATLELAMEFVQEPDCDNVNARIYNPFGQIIYDNGAFV